MRFFGTRKYASMASMVFREQGRRDDLETWLYVIYDIFDPENGLSWKNEVNVEKMLLERTRFFAGTGKFQIYVCQQSYAIVTSALHRNSLRLSIFHAIFFGFEIAEFLDSF